MASIDVRTGMTLEYDIRGEGEPILLVMGLGGQLIDYPEDFVDLFVAEGYQVIRFDNRDIGLSTHTEATPPSRFLMLVSLLTRRPLKGVGYTIDDMAADAAGLLEALNIRSAHVVGMSMGGMIAQAMTINHRSSVKSLCSIMSNTGDRKNGNVTLKLIRAVGSRGAPKPENAIDDWVFLLRAISGEHFDEAETRSMAAVAIERGFTPSGVARQTAAIGGSGDRTRSLGRVAVPTLVIHGLQDLLIKPSGGIATTKAIPGSRLVMYPDMGHDLPRPRWGEIRDAIVSNIRRTVAV